mmetsp:Transcript_27568/g.79195  ORF Transcript_27568/g.79195 Transcript_27568/m.79195 type:complete len:503 (+) Transcript_27568:79-1587(+)
MARLLRVQALLLCAVLSAAAASRGAGEREVGDAVALLQARAEPPSASDERPEALWQSLESEPPASSDSFPQALVNFGDAQYVAYMTLGRQMIAAILDTGSYDLVVFGVDCRSCGVAAHFNHHLSHSYWESPVSVEQFYGSGKALANSARERVAIGPYRIANQSFWNVKYAQMPVLHTAAFEAIFGLGPPDTPVMNAWTTAEQASGEVLAYYDQGLQAPDWTMDAAKRALDAANDATQNPPLLRNARCTRFSVCLGARSGADGVLVWNDTTALQQPELFRRLPVVGKRTWTVRMAGVHLAERSPVPAEDESVVLPGCPNGCSAIIDSGTSLLVMPTETIDAFTHLLNSRIGPNCSNLHQLPDIIFSFDGLQVSLPPDAYMGQVSGSLPAYIEDVVRIRHLKVDSRGGGTQCEVAVMESFTQTEHGPLWILGMPFFRKYYTTFHLGSTREERSFFIAEAGQDCSPASPGEEQQERRSLVRRVNLHKVHLPQTAQIAMKEQFAHL